jgi:hypothetical protein
MKLLTISAAGCVSILLLSAAANAGGSSQRNAVSAPALHAAIAPSTTTFNHRDIPQAPQNPYATSSGREPYSVPVQPQNPYPSSANRSSATPAQYAMPVAETTYGSSSGYAFRCVINQTGDYCVGTAAAPISAGTVCTCDRYNGYTQ